jgi:hypothetical protein
MTGNYMGSPHTNHNYPQNPSNNARQGSGSSGSQNNGPQGDKFTLTSQKGAPSTTQKLPAIASGLGVPTTRTMNVNPIIRRV